MADPVTFAIVTAAQIGISYLFPSEGPRIKDLKMSASTYGAVIPITWGTVRTGGNVIWADKVKETKRKQTGKGGSSYQYKYSCSVAIAFAQGPITQFRRIWADGKVIYDATGYSPITNKSKYNFTFYTGTDDQLPNALIQDILGEDDTPAFRGLAYVVMDNFDLTDFGNKLPQFHAEIYTAGDGFVTGDNSTSLGHIVTDLLMMGGLTEEQIDMTGLFGVKVVGYGFARGTDVKSAIEELKQVYMFELVEIEGKMVGNMRGGTSRTADGFNYVFETDGSFYQEAVTVGSIGLEELETYVIYGGRSDGVETDHLSIYRNGVKIYEIENPDGEDIGDISFSVRGALWDESDSGIILFFTTSGKYWACKWSRATETVTWTKEVPTYFTGSGNIKNRELCFLTTEVFGGFFQTVWVLDTKTGLWKYRDGTPASEATYHGHPIQDTEGGGILYSYDHQYYDSSTDTIVVMGGSSTTPALIRVGSDPYGTKLRMPNSTSFGTFQTSSLHVDYKRGRGYIMYIDPTYGRGFKRFRLTDGVVDYLITSQQTGGEPWAILGFLDRTGAVVMQTQFSNSCVVRLLNGEDYHTYYQDGASTNGFGRYPPTSQREQTAAMSQDIEGYESMVFRGLLGDVYRLYFAPNNISGTAIIPQDALGSSSPEANDYWVETRVQDADLPYKVSLGFINKDNDSQESIASATRLIAPKPTVNSRQRLDMALSLTMTAKEAKTQATQILYSQWTERRSHSTRLPWALLDLDPNDRIIVQMNDGRVFNDRLARMEMGADYNLQIDSYSQDSGAYLMEVLDADGGTGGWQLPPILEPTDCQAFVINTPLLRDMDDTNAAYSAFYAGMGRLGTETNPFDGGNFFRSYNDLDYDYLFGTDDELTWGTVSGTLAKPATGNFALDWKTKITITPKSTDFVLESLSDDELWAGGNACMVGDEVLQFRDAVENGNGTWTISNLLRGRRGTEYACDNHVAGEKFILLEEAGLALAGDNLDSRGQTRYFRAVGDDNYLETAQTLTVVYEPRDLMPYAPKDIRREIVGTVVNVDWKRRTRTGGNMQDFTGTVPLRETSERYEVYFLADAFDGDLSRGNAPETYLAKFETTSPNVSWETSGSGFDPILDTLHICVYQLSSTVGRGFPGTRSIAPWDDF